MKLIANKVSNRSCEHPDGCERPKKLTRTYIAKDGTVKQYYRKYCEGHCNRLHRKGSTGLGSAEIKLKNKDGEGSIGRSGYRQIYMPSHSLASKSGVVAAHRIVLYDAIGPDPVMCHWGCGKTLVWKETLTVDHLDFDKLNNIIGNLVPSCSSCNLRRFNVVVRYIIKNKLLNLKEITPWDE